MVSFEFPSSRAKTRSLAIEFATVAIACALLVPAAYLLEYQSSSSGSQSVSRLFQQFNLGRENNLAAWFSGAFLALVALHAMDGHTLFRSERPRVARAWALIAGVLLFLSADEIGSLHERLAFVGESIGVGSWGLLLPIGAVLALILIWAFVDLWRDGGARRKQVFILMAGFALLGSAAMQEFLEFLSWETAGAKAARITIEEGSELLGMLILLGVAMSMTAEIVDGASRRVGTVFAILTERRRVLLVGLIALAPVVTFLTAGLEDQHRGRPSDWLASMAFLSAAAVVAGGWIQGRNGHASLVPVGLLLALSCASIAIAPGGVVDAVVVSTSRRAVLLVALVVMALTACEWAGILKVSLSRLVSIAVVCLALLALSGSRGLELFLTVLLGAIMFLEMSLAQERESALEGVSRVAPRI